MGTDRRAFIRRSLYSILSLLGAGSLASLFLALRPRENAERVLSYVPLVSEDDVPRSGVKKAELAYRAEGREHRTRVFIVAGPEGISVLSAVCSHLGCLVNYRRETREFVCPCHGGKYDLAGRNREGPPPAPLTRLPHRIEQGMVMVGVTI